MPKENTQKIKFGNVVNFKNILKKNINDKTIEPINDKKLLKNRGLKAVKEEKKDIEKIQKNKIHLNNKRII